MDPGPGSAVAPVHLAVSVRSAAVNVLNAAAVDVLVV